MKTILTIGLAFLLSHTATGQLNKITLGANLIPTYYSHDQADLLDYAYFDGTKANNLVWFKGVYVDYMLTEHFGIQLGFQQHHLNLENEAYVLEYTPGSEAHPTKDFDRSVKVTSKQYELPVHLILTKPINERLNLSLLVGGARLKRAKVKYTFTDKASQAMEHLESDLDKDRVVSKFSPQLSMRMQYALMHRLNITGLLFLKSRAVANLEKVNVGVGLGISYSLH